MWYSIKIIAYNGDRGVAEVQFTGETLQFTREQLEPALRDCIPADGILLVFEGGKILSPTSHLLENFL